MGDLGSKGFKSRPLVLTIENPLLTQIDYINNFKGHQAKQQGGSTEKKAKNDKQWCLVFLEKNIEKNKTQLIGLKSKTKYTFRVRVIHEGDEWPYSKQSEVIETKESMAATLVGQSRLAKRGTPSVYSLPAKEDTNARNSEKKTKKYELGTKDKGYNRREKTIMLVGATGTGKTTLVDGIVNYVLGVNLGDPFRFTIVELEKSERNKLTNQAESQTEWITCYTIYSSKNGGRLDFTLTIVDTPGFGDTRGIGYDKKIVYQIKHLFSEQGPRGILSLDAICFLNKAPDARLTTQQKYVFQQILSMFGKDVEENICSLITFADGQEPPVFHCLRESKLPINKDFCFNNSALFASNGTESSSGFSTMFWNMGHESFKKFFSHIQNLKPKSLEMTRNVLHERETLENTIENIQQQVSSGLFTISSLREEIRIFRQHKTDAEEAIGMLKEDMKNMMLAVQERMAVVKRCNERLKEMALRPNPLSMVEYIDIMIEAEEFEPSNGYRERITELKFYRERATTDKKAEQFLAIRLDEELNMD
ncbi:uncharacterized protein LOC123543430 [Mercenaria mercenaria]|uniref:uncharacterized protein LOC123543430 n=1 Tax=Mercenaria mercenaria TaxID=6596 RepID=UPI00234F918C|nr:uncharacterized protein LOC123543430 [Mercenaria mercenaria]